MDKWDPNWNNSGYASRDNYWAGAKKACDELGMSLPNKSKLKSIYEAGKKDSSLGLPTSGWFWSSSERNGLYAYGVSFDNGTTQEKSRKSSDDFNVLCVGD